MSEVPLYGSTLEAGEGWECQFLSCESSFMFCSFLSCEPSFLFCRSAGDSGVQDCRA